MASFAQFEREVTGERIRDKIAASKTKGLWMGGVVPLGYRAASRKLVIDDAEAATVRFIFQRYLDLGSIRALQRDFLEKGIQSRSRVLASGRSIGGVPFTNGPLNHLLKNRMYLGEINHRGTSYPGDHSPIIDAEIFDAVSAKLEAQRNFADLRKSKSGALLKGRLFNEAGALMSPAHTMKKGIRYRYYVSTPTVQGRASDPGSIRRVSAPEVEALVLKALQDHRTETWEASRDFNTIDLRVAMQKDGLDISWIVQATSSALPDVDVDEIAKRMRIVVSYDPKSHKRRREILPPTNASGYVQPMPEEQRSRLVLAIAQGKAWLREVLAGMPTETIAARENKSERAIRLTLSLAFLDPTLVKAALQGSLPRSVSARRLLDAPANWHDQWRAVGLSRPA